MELAGYLDPAHDEPGFLLPLFRRARGANLDFSQVIDLDDKVASFIETVLPASLIRPAPPDVLVEVGDPAIWAFKDASGKIHLGGIEEMRSIATDLLQNSELMQWPLARLELGSFRDKFADVELLQAAYKSVRQEGGQTAAEVWRDTEVFTPAVRKDIKRYEEITSQRVDKSRILTLFSKKLNIFTDDRLLPIVKVLDLQHTRHALAAFGASPDVLVHSLRKSDREWASRSIWRIRGIGGVARHVVKSRPFTGHPYRVSAWQSEDGVEAEGSLVADNDAAAVQSQFIAIAQSIDGQVQAMATEVLAHPPQDFVRHLINVRPFNFGSPPPRKTPVEQLSSVGRHFDHVWIVAGHRQRRTGTYRNQLSVTNAASRLVRSLLLSLQRRADIISDITRDGTPTVPSLNLFGTLRARSDWAEREAVENLLHSMLCEEALLHTADRIIVLSPGAINAHIVDARLGNRRYRVEVLPDGRAGRSSELVGWALSVKLTTGQTSEFADFCVQLMDGYGWNFRGPDGEALLFEDEGEGLRIWPVSKPSSLVELLNAPAEYGRNGDVIVTTHTVTRPLAQVADDMDWALVHYSELPNWLRQNYTSGRFGDPQES